MSNEFDYNHSPSSSPSPKNQFIENIIEIARKDEAIKATLPEIERFVEELFYHISKFSDDDLTFGRIAPVTDKDVDLGEYQISQSELRYFNNLIKILNRLFRISRGTI
jgi:hypothetical protein